MRCARRMPCTVMGYTGAEVDAREIEEEGTAEGMGCAARASRRALGGKCTSRLQ